MKEAKGPHTMLERVDKSCREFLGMGRSLHGDMLGGTNGKGGVGRAVQRPSSVRSLTNYQFTVLVCMFLYFLCGNIKVNVLSIAMFYFLVKMQRSPAFCHLLFFSCLWKWKDHQHFVRYDIVSSQ